MNFKWVEKKGQYQSGESLYLNRILIAGYHWNGSQAKSVEHDDSINWEGYIDLPSQTEKSKTVYGSSEVEVKSRIEKVVKFWFNEALDLTGG